MLDRGFNVAVRTIAARLFPTGFDVTPDEGKAPATLAALRHEVAKTGRMLVWSGGSERTIFGCADTNHHFRAWHDWCHLKHGLEFTLEGERAAAHVQAQHLIQRYGVGHTDLHRWLRILYAEVIAQAEHFEYWREFPNNQKGFTARAMEDQVAHEFADAAMDYATT
jgi:hypothetical protein